VKTLASYSVHPVFESESQDQISRLCFLSIVFLHKMMGQRPDTGWTFSGFDCQRGKVR
jgi:hypothetical protein